MTGVAIVGASALSAFGAGARGLSRALTEGAVLPGLPAETPLQAPRARKMMSRSAYLAARCLADLLASLDGAAAWTAPRADIGYFLGVGASGGSLDDVTALLAASIGDDGFSLARFGDRGLAACNPLLAFQLMNNFTMCHGAILEELGGPNSAVFSRGAGTIAALAEAVAAVRGGACACAVAGGADEATHPVTVAELGRDGLLARGLHPADGAGLVALAAATGADDVVVLGCAHASGRDRGIADAFDDALARAGATELAAIDRVVIAPWGPPAADALRSFVAARFPAATILETSLLGEALAATAALAVVTAADALRDAVGRIAVLTLGVDGDPGVVLLARGGAA